MAWALAGCNLDSTGANGQTEGIGVDASTDGTGLVTSGGPATDDASASAEDDTAACAGLPNACGGCTNLPAEPGTTCNGCDGKTWACDGTEALVCTGFDPAAIEWFPDADGDGFGDADAEALDTCEDPPAGWVDDDGDCDDADGAVHPGADEICNGIDDDCDAAIDEAPDNTLCDDVCCSFELACDGTGCNPKCPGVEICGEKLDVCCAANEVCFANDCVVPGIDCEFTEQCAIDEICAPGLGVCVPADTAPMCEFVPPPGVFDPQLGCKWSSVGLPNPAHDDVVGTPIVINLTDDNADGVTDHDDIPDIAFLTYDLSVSCCNTNATLRIVSGQCNGDQTMTTIASISTPILTNDTGIAAGDLDGDGVPELVAVMRANGLVQGTVALRRTADDGSTWDVLWENPTYPTWNVHTRGGAVISLYDLDADGTPEVVIGNVVLDGLTGALVWDGVVTVPGGGIGNNGFLGPSSAVADLDLDGFGEVLAGNTVYEHDGTLKWTFPYTTSNSPCGGQLPCDGFNAVANFDDDDFGEVVIVRRGEVFLLDQDGTPIDQMALPSIDCVNNESGPPTIADFDGDGQLEIGTASADYYVVVDFGCTGPGMPDPLCTDDDVLWRVQNQDCSSRVTASSVFDFEGDGAAEVVYADETSFRIFDGATGAIEFSDDTFGSHTRIEMPVVADVDNDGNAEVVVAENGYGGGTPGIEVWQDPLDNWVRTRRVWNQHAYAITHITEDGTIPAAPETNWLNERFNNFRQNVQPDGLFNAPDAAIDGILCGLVAAAGSFQIDISLVVRNEGALTLPAGTPVRIELEQAGMITFLLDTATTVPLHPGQFEVINVSTPLPPGAPNPPFTLRAIVDPDLTINECIEDNNALETLCAVPG